MKRNSKDYNCFNLNQNIKKKYRASLVFKSEN